jgi:hypothetical protein
MAVCGGMKGFKGGLILSRYSALATALFGSLIVAILLSLVLIGGDDTKQSEQKLQESLQPASQEIVDQNPTSSRLRYGYELALKVQADELSASEEAAAIQELETILEEIGHRGLGGQDFVHWSRIEAVIRLVHVEEAKERDARMQP